MPEQDFVLTYPCYILMQTEDVPDVILANECDKCICLFTDAHLVEQFAVGVLGAQSVQVAECADRGQLIALIESWSLALSENGINHVAIDATPDKQVGYVLISELIAGI